MRFFPRQIGQRHDMPVGADEEMAVGVGKFVHDNERVGSPVQNETFPVFLLSLGKAENAAVRLGAQNILDAPRRPELFHQNFLCCLKPSPLRGKAVRGTAVTPVKSFFCSFSLTIHGFKNESKGGKGVGESR